MSYRISEIFMSIQGEGESVGAPAMFVRFAGCNLDCEFCDTDHAITADLKAHEIADVAMMQAEGVGFFKEAMPFKPLFVFTGGEPLLQLDRGLVETIRALGFRVAIETNGAKDTEENAADENLSELLNSLDEVVVSPKSKDTSGLIMSKATCLKVLVPFPGDIDVGHVHRMAGSGLYGDDAVTKFRARDRGFVLQPVTPLGGPKGPQWSENCTLARGMAYKLFMATARQWRVIPQTHLFMEYR